MTAIDQVLASTQLTIWLVVFEVALVRTGVAGLFRGKWWWFRPITQSRVDRTEPAASLNEARFRRRRSELALAIGLGWLPGLIVQSLLGSANSQVNGAIVGVSAAAVALHIFSSLRRFDREGRARFVAQTIAEGQQRLDSAP